jgi:hypothetical protein
MSRTYKEMLSTAEFLEHVGQGRHLPPIPTFDGFLAEEEMAEEDDEGILGRSGRADEGDS